MRKELMWDKSCYGKDRSNEMPHFHGNVAGGFVRFMMRVCWRLKIEHIENIRVFQGKTGFVLVSNHTSYLDVATIYCCVRMSQWVRFIAREDVLKHWFAGAILCRAGAFPVKRDAADRKCIKRASKMLKNQEIVGIMPEGTRRGKSGRKPELHSGAAFIARMGGNVPIVPCTARNVEKVKQKGKMLRFPKVTCDFGDPIMLRDFDFLPKQERLDGATWYAMRQVFALNRRCKAEDVDMVELFPDAKDYTQVFAEHPIPHHTAAEIAAEYSSAGTTKSNHDQQSETATRRSGISVNYNEPSTVSKPTTTNTGCGASEKSGTSTSTNASSPTPASGDSGSDFKKETE